MPSPLFALVAMLGFGSQDVLNKKALAFIEPLPAVLRRYTAEAILFAFAGLFFGRYVLPPPAAWPLLLAMALMGGAGILFFFKAMKAGRVAVVYPFAQLASVFPVLSGLFLFGESLSPMQALGIVLVFAAGFGVALENPSLRNLRLAPGIHYALLTAAGWGVGYTLFKPLTQLMGPFLAAAYSETSVFFALFILALLTRNIGHVRGRPLAFIVGAALLTTVAITGYAFSVAERGLSFSGAFLAGAPVISVVLARIFLGEALSLRRYLAVVVLAVGLVLLVL